MATQATQTVNRMQPARARARPLELSTPAAPAPAPVQQVATAGPDLSAVHQAIATFWAANQASNAAARVATTAKKALHQAMVTANVVDVASTVPIGDKQFRVSASISAPDEEVISVERLKALVDDATFMRIVKATKTAVTEIAGTNVALAATVTQKAKEDLRVREIK